MYKEFLKQNSLELEKLARKYYLYMPHDYVPPTIYAKYQNFNNFTSNYAIIT